MKKRVIGLVSVFIVGASVAGYVFMYPNSLRVSDNLEKYSNQELGIAFTYRSGPNGYVLQEMKPAKLTDKLLSTIVLIQSKDIDQKPIGGEGAPTITIYILKNIKKENPQIWADANFMYSNINLKTGLVEKISIDGVVAIRYMADGLYASENVIATHGNNVYVISGMFIEQDSALRRDYQPLLDSIRFMAPSKQQ